MVDDFDEFVKLAEMDPADRVSIPRYWLSSLSVDYLDISVQTANALAAAGVYTLWAAHKLTRCELMRRPGIGPRRANEIIEAMKAIQS